MKVTIPVTTPLVTLEGPILAGNLNPGDIIACAVSEWVEWLPVTSLGSPVECSGYRVVANGLPPFDVTRRNEVLTTKGFHQPMDALRLTAALRILRVDGEIQDEDDDMILAAYNYMVSGKDVRFDYDPREVFGSDGEINWDVHVGDSVPPVINYMFLWSGECVSFEIKSDGVMLSSGIIVR